MAGRCLPERPHFRAGSEERVWQAVRSRMRPTDVLLSGVRFTGRDGDWEADLVLLTPEGFATIEVKGGQVRFDGGEYVQLLPTGPHRIDLADQAVSEKYLVRRHLAGHPSWNLPSPRMVHVVALPDTALSADADFGPGLPRRLVLARGEEREAVARILEALRGPLTNQPKAAPGEDGVERAAEILGGRGDSQADVAALRALRDDVVRRLTDGQCRVLDLTRMMPRYQVVGGPGSGKTYLAIEQARRWASQGLAVAFVAYSKGLTTWVDRVVRTWPPEVRDRVSVVTFHGLGHSWGAVASDGATQSEWDETIPRRMAELAADLADADRFDAVVVDEGQDFGASWWPALLAAFRDAGSGRLAVFSDAAQRVFGRDGVVDLGIPVLPLDENLRSSGPIGEAVNALLATSMAIRGGYGPAVRFVQCEPGDAVATADAEADRLIERGWPHADVALLTTHHRHPVQVELVGTHQRDGYWDAFWDDSQFFYSTVAGFKGLERPAVVLAVDGFRDVDTARETLLVGMSRARDLLVVCGDQDELRRVGGKVFAKRLKG